MPRSKHSQFLEDSSSQQLDVERIESRFEHSIQMIREAGRSWRWDGESKNPLENADHIPSSSN